MPDVYDTISAKIIETVGFMAVKYSGYSFTVPQDQRELNMSFEENLEWTRRIEDADFPVMADAKDGFRNPQIGKPNYLVIIFEIRL